MSVLLAALTAALIYGVLLRHLVGHVSFKPSAESGAGCIDSREHAKYRVPGGTGTFSFGLVPLLAYFYVSPWSGFLFLAMVQFFMSLADMLILWKQAFENPGAEFILLRSHGLRHPGCGRTSAWDPIGASIYFIQIKTGWSWLGYVRGVVQLPYDLVGVIPGLVVNLPLMFVGKFVLPIPF